MPTGRKWVHIMYSILRVTHLEIDSYQGFEAAISPMRR